MITQLPTSGRNICLLDDVFRCEANEMQSFPSNMLLLDGVLSPIMRATGGTVTRVASHGFGQRQVDVSPVLKHFGLPGGQVSWAKLLEAETDETIERWLEPYLDGFDVIVGFELPNIIFQAACALGHPVLDIALSPIRFLEDLCFDIRCSDSRIAELLAVARISDDEIVRNLSQIHASVQRRWGAIAPVLKYGTTGLLLGQSRIDASLVENGEVRQIGEYSDRIADWAKNFETIILKPHPYGPQKIPLDRLRQTGVRLFTTTANPYQLFVCSNVTGAAAISSGSLIEAKWFGLDTLQFLQSPRQRLRTNAVDPVSSAFLTAPFWLALLEGKPLPDRLERLPSVRQQMNSNWGYDPSYPDVRLRPVSWLDRIRQATGMKI